MKRLTMHGFRAGLATKRLAEGGDPVVLAEHQRRQSTGAALGHDQPRDASVSARWLAEGGDPVPLAEHQRRKGVESVLGDYLLAEAPEDSRTRSRI